MEGDLITSGSLDSICRRHADLLKAYHKASQRFNQQADDSRFAYFEPTKGKLTHHFGGKMNSFLADSRENTPPSAHMNTAVNSHGIGFAKLSCLSISMVVLSDEKMHQIP